MARRSAVDAWLRAIEKCYDQPRRRRGESVMMIHKKIRIHRKDAAFTYAILESLEGMVSYSTLDNAPGQAYRDLALYIPEGFVEEMNIILEGLRKKFPVIELE